MVFFMDGDGIPLIFGITPRNTNEQKTLKPLEERIINDFSIISIISLFFIKIFNFVGGLRLNSICIIEL